MFTFVKDLGLPDEVCAGFTVLFSFLIAYLFSSFRSFMQKKDRYAQKIENLQDNLSRAEKDKMWYVTRCQESEDTCKAIFMLAEIKAYKKSLTEKSGNIVSFNDMEKLNSMQTELALLLKKIFPEDSVDQSVARLIKKYAPLSWNS